MRGPIVARASRSPGPSGIEENFRTFRTGPQSERGGTIACTTRRPVFDLLRTPRCCGIKFADGTGRLQPAALGVRMR
jgi:hypothetical protein